MSLEHPHSVTQSVKAIFLKYGLIKTALAFARAYWPALTVIVTVIVAGTISVIKIDEVLTGYKAQALLNQHFATSILRLDARLDASLQAINQKVDAVATKVDAVATTANETAAKLHSLYEDERVTVTIAPKKESKPVPSTKPSAPHRKDR